jgi:putative NADPH-quinone reductase
MNNILLISGHPDIAHSTANRIIVEELVSDMRRITTTDIMMNYPDYNIDVEAEQELLKSADLIIIQAPFMWYGLPAHVRLWIEKVFAWGFAHGEGGDKLKGKSLVLSFTSGSEKNSYSAAGKHGYTVEYFLKPMELFVKYCGMNYLPPVFSYEMNAHTEIQKDATIAKARLQAELLKELIRQYSKEKTDSLILRA